jgi:Na+-translocating ferredoxin:NAD+ oxidoreductase subunit E
MKIPEELKRGLFAENPLAGAVLGLCPALAVTTTATNAVGMGAVLTFAIICSGITISLLNRWIPEKISIPAYITVIAAFVTVADMLMNLIAPDISGRLGIYVQLIAANCIILSKTGQYATAKSLTKSGLDSITTGAGFSAALIIIAAIREILGNNTLFGHVLVNGFKPAAMFMMAPGGFFVVAFLVTIVKCRKIYAGKGTK